MHSPSSSQKLKKSKAHTPQAKRKTKVPTPAYFYHFQIFHFPNTPWPQTTMVAEPPSSDSAVDPLSSYYGLALFPDSFRVQPDPTKSWDFDADLDSIHNHLKSIVNSLSLSLSLYLSL